MSNSIWYVFSGISIILLVIYGADVIVGGGGAGEGFLPFDAMTRGIAFGFPPMILSVIVFVKSKPPYKVLGAMLLVTGILIIIGGVMSVVNAGNTGNPARMIGEGSSIIAMGGIISVLGLIKIRKTQTSVS